ncbi:MAG: hypothetical protein VST70_01300, partial [Nitrospirota bacterium]|nr:hypothetical protein [Nitrospirota bacterium]
SGFRESGWPYAGPDPGLLQKGRLKKIALVHDTLVQNGGASIPLGQIHGKMGVFFLFLASLRILGGGNPATLRLRRLWIGVDLALLLLLFGTALLGERLVFHQGLGLSNLFTNS